MIQTLRNAWKIPDLRKKILYTILLLVVFRFGSIIPVPGLDKAVLQSLVGAEGSLFGFFDIISGGAFGNATIFAMSITPYINASIILQLLTIAIPALERLAKEGEEGRKKIAQITRYVTIVLGFIQAAGLYAALGTSVKEPGILSFVVITLTFTAGTAFLMWLGELITEKGVGNGISLIIFIGIISRLDDGVKAIYNYMAGAHFSFWSILAMVILVAVSLLLVGFVVSVNEAERRIPVQYAKRVVGRKMYGGQSTYIPLKVAMAGVMPIIFAMSILSFPATLANLFGQPTAGTFWFKFLSVFNPNGWVYAILYFILIIFFTYFYTSIQFNPIEMSNNIKRNGGFVQGIRPGKPTSDYIAKVLSKVTLIGALAIAVIAVFPIALNGAIPSMQISLGGTSVLIAVSVALETTKQLESQMLMRHYKGFLE